jgi:hypothetical protein
MSSNDQANLPAASEKVLEAAVRVAFRPILR